MRILGSFTHLVILDMDGVILDILGRLRRNLEEAASHFHLPLEPIAIIIEHVAQGRIRIKGNARDSTRALWPWLTEEEISGFETYFYDIERKCPYAVIEGSLEVISFLRAHDIPVALATNNPMKSLLWRLEAAKIDLSWFAAITTKDDAHFKPHPGTFDTIFERVRVARDHTLYVGDLQIDWDTARGAGVMFAAVLTGGVPREAFLSEGVPATHILERLDDILKYIEA